ncbi:FAD-dependent monooxygenase [Qaidamihabitans albus]|uniref:FAD-dependent monooxygenase n=1 Tax=Qaidamihabitans albus TaxID=2795733 RepID=UPI0018F21761|nr:FAD-dependent monooxygenase [Qaidamihabitans albus]
MSVDERVPVLVVGAGLAGSSAAMFLGLHGVPPLLVERHAGTSAQPKARGQSWHAMEALRIAGVHQRVRDAGYDVDAGMPIVIAQSVAGPVLHEIVGDAWPDWSHLTREEMGMASQEKTEPILLERARELGARVRFSTRLDALEQEVDGVRARLTDLTTGSEYTVHADHVVAADGRRSPLRRALGIGVHGRGPLGHSVAVQFEADLSDLVGGREFALFYLQNNPTLADGATLVSTDRPGHWVFMVPYDSDAGDRVDYFTEEHLIACVRAGVGVPTLPVTVLDATPTTIAHQVADRFTCGRVHLVGDAAHTMPPHGGQGGSTAIMDGFYLAWKLAAVVRGWAGPGLLSSHDVERRPYGALIAGQQYTNMITRSRPELADGTEDPPVPPEELLFGYRYPDGAIVPEQGEDGARLEDPATATGRPGSRAPHVWLPGGRSTMDLFGRGFVLLTVSPRWVTAAREVAVRLGVPLHAERLPAGDWTTRYGVTPNGASLVRPDRFVAWRAHDEASASELESALRTILAR